MEPRAHDGTPSAWPRQFRQGWHSRGRGGRRHGHGFDFASDDACETRISHHRARTAPCLPRTGPQTEAKWPACGVGTFAIVTMAQPLGGLVVSVERPGPSAAVDHVSVANRSGGCRPIPRQQSRQTRARAPSSLRSNPTPAQQMRRAGQADQAAHPCQTPDARAGRLCQTRTQPSIQSRQEAARPLDGVACRARAGPGGAPRQRPLDCIGRSHCERGGVRVHVGCADLRAFQKEGVHLVRLWPVRS